MNPSEDPNDRLIDSLLSEQSKGKPDEALLRAIASEMQAAPKARSPRRSLDFFWPATAAAVVLLAAGGLLWKAFEKKGPEERRLVEAPGLDPAEAPERGTSDGVLATNRPEPSDDGPTEHDGMTREGEADLAGVEKVQQDPDQGSGNGEGEIDPFGAEGGFVLPGDDGAELASEAAGKLLDELRLNRVESTMWYVQFGLESDGKWAPRFAGLAPDQKRLVNRVSAVEMLSVGDTFFKEGEMAGRFKFLGFTERQVLNERTGMRQNVKFAQYEDLKPNKRGERYESHYGLPDAQVNEKAYHDRTAVLEFGGKEFKVEERTEFTLPPGGKALGFFLRQVTPEKIVVEFKGADGKVAVREIAR